MNCSLDPLPIIGELRVATRLLRKVARELKHDMGLQTVFRPHAYRSLVAAAREIAVQRQFIAA